MQEKIIEALHFYGIKDEKYKKRCLEVVYDIIIHCPTCNEGIAYYHAIGIYQR